MTEKTRSTEWMNVFFSPLPKDQDPYGALFAVGRVALTQVTTLQRAALDFYRQVVESETAERPVRAQQEEFLRKWLEAMDPLFSFEQTGRQQFLKSQASLFDLYEEALRRVTRHGEHREKPKSA